MAIENVGPGGVSRSGGARTRTAVNEADGGHAYWGTDANNNTVLVAGADGIMPMLGGNMVTVGAGGQYSGIEAALTGEGAANRYVVRHGPYTKVVTTAAATAIFTATAATFITDKVRTGDFIKLSDSSTYFRIKSVDSETQLTLHENYGTTISGVSKTFSVYRLDWLTLLLLPGEHTIASTATNLPSGYNLYALDPNNCFLSETGSGRVFNTISECNFFGVAFKPTVAWAALDGIMSSSPTIPAGASISFTNCLFSPGNNGDHAGNNLWLPTWAKCTVEYNNCTFNIGSASSYDTTGAGATVATTFVNFNNCNWVRWLGRDVVGAINASTLSLPLLGLAGTQTYNFNGGSFYSPDYSLDVDGILNIFASAISVMSASVVNINGTKIRMSNTDPDGAPTYGVAVLSSGTGAEVNIHGADIEASGPATSAGVFIGAAATVNVRTGTRIKGTTDAVVVPTGATLNYTTQADLINGTSGVGTITNVAT